MENKNTKDDDYEFFKIKESYYNNKIVEVTNELFKDETLDIPERALIIHDISLNIIESISESIIESFGPDNIISKNFIQRINLLNMHLKNSCSTGKK